MTYSVKEIYYTLQGEGAQAGRPAVFCRFTGCNLWTGKERHREQAICQFCDTDFVGTDGPGGGKFATPRALADAIASQWPKSVAGGNRFVVRFVVCTGGEPLLQVDDDLVAALHQRRFEVAVETNGTKPAPNGLDWICVSPKAGTELVLKAGHELKLVFPQQGAMPEAFEGLAFDHFSLQPMDGGQRVRNTRLAIDYCKAHPRWRLSVQMHKYLNIP